MCLALSAPPTMVLELFTREGASVLLSCAPFLASPCVWPLGLAGPVAYPCGGSGGRLSVAPAVSAGRLAW